MFREHNSARIGCGPLIFNDGQISKISEKLLKLTAGEIFGNGNMQSSFEGVTEYAFYLRIKSGCSHVACNALWNQTTLTIWQITWGRTAVHS
jgi:hypothetical protein